MRILSESHAQNWRAVVVFAEDSRIGLLLVGRSSAQIRRDYPAVLEDYAGVRLAEVQLQQWSGAPDKGKWIDRGPLKMK